MGVNQALPSAGRARRGISLLEVLISMFVLMIGLMGVAALIPLGRFEVLEGAKADRGVSMARVAQHETKIRGLLRPVQIDSTGNPVQMWMTSAGYSTTTATVASGFTMPFSGSGAGNFAFALDPLSIAVNAAFSGGDVSTFPPSSSCESPSTMMRITLRAGANSGYTAMTPAMADSIFRSQDDLLFATATRGDFAPTQQFPFSGVTRRQSEGDYSWLATVVPANQVPVLTSGAGAGGDPLLMRVSFVVFYKRNVLITTASASVAPPERLVKVNAGALGIAGGEVQLSTTTQANYLDVKPNQWILLSQPSYAVSGSSPATTAPPWYRWYKVLATDVTQGTSPWTRNVTLVGPDWNPGSPAGATFASIFDGAISVYEREIELEETGSLWSPN